MSYDWTETDDDEGRLDPAATPIGLDANVLDRNAKRDDDLDRLLALAASDRIRLWMGASARAEMTRAGRPLPGFVAEGPRTMDHGSSRRAMTAAHHLARIRVRAIVCGNARPGKHDADAAHLSEAAEAGCGYFITYDSRLLRKRQDLQTIALPTMTIVTIEEILAIFDSFSG